MRDSEFDLGLEMMQADAYLQTLSDGPEKKKVADYLQELHQEQQRRWDELFDGNQYQRFVDELYQEQQQRLAESFDASKLETKSS
jgi:hypothetical protein